MFAKSENTYLPIRGTLSPFDLGDLGGKKGGEIVREGGIGLEMAVNLEIV
jgi:hypothetical protein